MCILVKRLDLVLSDKHSILQILELLIQHFNPPLKLLLGLFFFQLDQLAHRIIIAVVLVHLVLDFTEKRLFVILKVVDDLDDVVIGVVDFLPQLLSLWALSVDALLPDFLQNVALLPLSGSTFLTAH